MPPWAALLFALFHLYLLADVLFTGGDPTTALSTALILTYWMAEPWLRGHRERRQETRAHP